MDKSLAKLLGVCWWLGSERGGRIRGAQGARRRRSSKRKKVFHGGSGLYPRSDEPAVDEDVRATPAGKQLRGQVRDSAGRGGSAPTAEHLPCSSTVGGLIQPVLGYFAKFSQNLN